MPTIKDIARASGVSYPTVSHVLNRTRIVSPKTQKKVFDAVEQLGYIPNGVARGLRRSRMNAIGILVSVHSLSFFEDHCHGPITEAAIFAAQQFDQSATLYFARSNPELPERLPLYCDGRCDGLILVGQRTDSDFVQTLKRRSYPFVCVTESWEMAEIPYVDADQIAMADTLAEYLLQLGHRKFAILCGDGDQINVAQRLVGCHQAFGRWGIPAVNAEFIPGSYLAQTGYDRVRSLLESRPRAAWPTAIYCFNDFLAHEAIRALTEFGVKCPEEITVVGIDNARESKSVTPALTTMRLPLLSMGQRAVEMLMGIIDSAPDNQLNVNLPAELIVRESSAPPRSS